MKLTAATRDKLTAGQFALPGGRYPVNDKPHAANAKARATQQFQKGNLSAGDKATVDAKANTILGALKGKFGKNANLTAPQFTPQGM